MSAAYLAAGVPATKEFKNARCKAKRVCSSKRAAKDSIVKGNGKRLSPYLCACGAWHLTSQKQS
jgi:hypothetical protein